LNKFILTCFTVLLVFISACSNNSNQDKNFKIFNTSDSLKIQVLDSLKLLQNFQNIKQTTSDFDENIWVYWSINNLSNSPKNVHLISRTLYDFNLFFYVFDSRDSLKESKNIYWGMPNAEREVDSYMPVKSMFLDSKESVKIVVSIKKAFRKSNKLFFEIDTEEINSELNFRKLIDALFSAIVLLNILILSYVIFKFKAENQLWVYYLGYNFLILLAAFLRYYTGYFSPVVIPAIFNHILEYFLFSAAFFYFCFGLLFIEYDKKLFLKRRKESFFLVLICLITLVIPSWAYQPLAIMIRFGLMFILMVKFYQILFRLRHQIFSKLFISISGIFLMMTMLNSIYSNFSFFGFQNTYGIEFNKIAIMIESFLLFGGLIFRQKVKKRANILSFFL
jgi:hypothetical protein